MITRSILLSAGLLLATGNAIAHSDNIDAKKGSGYFSSGESIVTTGLDSCLRSGDWSSDGQINACEGIEDAAPEVAEPVEVAEVVETPAQAPAQVDVQTLNGEALFATNSAELGSEGNQAMDSLLSDLAEFKNIIAITVTGHTDSIGSEAYNQDLSTRRAQTVANVIAERFPDAAIAVAGMGETSPIDSNDTEAGRMMNRRVNITIEASRMVFN